MTDPHRHTVAAVAACLAAGLLLATCSKSTPAAHTTSAVQTTAAATDAPSVAATNAASAKATPPAASPAASGHLHACLLVSEQDATTALGADPGTGREETQESAFGASGTCNYRIESG